MRVDWFMNVVGHWPDGMILLAGAGTMAVTSVAVAFVARRTLFLPAQDRISEHAKLADIVHSSLLAFAVFVLALVLTDVRSNMGKADDSVLREASALSRLDRELALIGGAAANAERTRLRTYVSEIVTQEWPSLGKAEPELSSDVTATMTALIAGIRAIVSASPGTGSTLSSLLDKLDDLRQARLESATRTVPAIFWWLIGVFLLGAMVLNGRHPIDPASVSLITLHMAAIGLVVAFIVVMDEPFRGESSIQPTPILNALGPFPSS